MKHKRKTLLLGVLLWSLLTPAFLFSQAAVKGNITDSQTGEPLIGATVFIRSLAKGTITDFDGNYVFNNLPAGEYELEVAFTGYSTTTRKVALADGSEVAADFELGVNATDLEIIVVTGTGGPVQKKKIGNTVGLIDTKKLENAPITSFSDLLQGREPSLVAIPSGGLTGEGTQIRIRGSASLSQLNEPIIYIDGVRVDRGGGFGAGGFVSAGGGGSPSRLDDINPESIERVEVLKGASAATLYGTEASNGVIQIFTKKGTSGAPQFDFQLSSGFIEYPDRFPNNVGFARSADQAAGLSSYYGQTLQPYQLISRNTPKELFETGTINTASAAVSGGNSSVNYYVTGRWTDTDGPFGGNNRQYPEGVSTRAQDLSQRGQFNINLNIFPSEKFNFRVTSGYTDSKFSTLQTNNNIFGVGSLAQFSKPELAGPGNQTGTIAFATVNEVMQVTIDQDVKHYNGSIGLNYYPLEALSINAVFGVDFSNSSAEEFWPFRWNIDGFASTDTDGRKDYSDRKYRGISGEIRASLKNQLSSAIESNFILGAQLIRQEELIQSGSGVGFPGPGFEISSAGAAQELFEYFSEVINAGVFVQEQLGFANQFYLTLGARLDAHSAFGTNFNAAVYPKVGFSYIPSDRPNWRALGPISTLQFRGSYGWAGLQPGAFDALTTYQAITSTSGAGIAPNNLGNPDLEPEVSQEWEVATNLGLFDNKLSMEVVYWDRVVKDALFARQFPLSGGWRTRQLVNIGELSARGLEINVNTNVLNNRNWSLDLYANAAYLNEEVTSLGGAPPVKVGGSYQRYRNFLIEGFAPGAQFGAILVDTDENHLPIDFDNDGLPDAKEDIISFLSELTPETASLPTAPGKGGVLVKDDDGDGDLLDHFLGKSTPDWQGSFGGKLKFKNFTLSTLFEYKTGDYRINNLTGAFRQSHPAIGRNLPLSARVERDFITGGVDGNFNPQNSGEVRYEALKDWLFQALALDPFSGLNTIKKADFLRWRELSLTYQLPSSFLRSINLRTASFTVAARNLALFTSYDGVDPEINVFGRGGFGDDDEDFLDNTDQNFGVGIDAFGWPLPRQVLFTLKVGL